MSNSFGQKRDGSACKFCGNVHDERNKWLETDEVTGSYQIASSYESGNEYGPYSTEYTYRKVIKCSKCGREKF